MSQDSTSQPRRRILILFAHPAFDKSRVNTVLGDSVQGLDGVTFHDLYQAYPDFDIDVEREQRLLLEHDLIVLQHPFFWYSTPAILKEWQDLVLQHGWAYGSTGTALCGKMAMTVTTTGGREDAYHKDGHNQFTMGELLAPIAQTFRLCGLDYLPPFIVHGTLHMPPQTIAGHADDYRAVIEALRDDRLDLDAARQRPRINSELDAVLQA